MNRIAAIMAACAFMTVGCGSDLPHDKGVQWVCTLQVFDNNQILIPNYAQGECANADVSGSDILSACKDDCKNAFRKWGIFWYGGIFPWIYQNIQGCIPLGPPVDTHNACKPGSIIAYNGGPANYSLGVDESASTASLHVNGDDGVTTVSGNIDVTIGPKSCTGPNCNLLITTLHLTGQTFKIGGHSVTGVDVQNRGFINGTWHDDNTFELPAGAVTIGTNFAVDGHGASETLANSVSPLHGVLTKDGSTFSLDGDFQTSDGSIHLSIAAHAVASPPVARFAPDSGTFECDAPEGVAHVSFSSGASSDPDNDIIRRDWTVDFQPVGQTTDIATVLPLGSHVIQMGVIDSRGAWDSAAGTVTVVDTAPPSITASVTPDCLWPPNHKLALFQLGDTLKVNSTDVCTATPKVRITGVVSNQAPTGGGSGNTASDVSFGDAAFCVRNERDGTSSEPRVYTVTVEAVDEAGNRSTKQVTVTVPHDMGEGAAQCAALGTGSVVDDGDPRCTATLPPSAPPASAHDSQENPSQKPRAAGCSAVPTGEAPHGTVFIFVLGALLLRRRGWLVMVLALAVGCSSSPSVSFGTGPVAGTSQGSTFSIAGSRATWNSDQSSLSVLLANYSASCGSASPTPAQGQTEIEAVLSLPSSDAKPGTYQLSSNVAADSTQPGLGLTNYTLDGSGSIKQTTTIISKGALRIDQMSASQLTGALGVNDNNVSLTGTFSAVICP